MPRNLRVQQRWRARATLKRKERDGHGGIGNEMPMPVDRRWYSIGPAGLG